MFKKLQEKSGVSLIFAVLVSMALIISTATLNTVIVRNIERVGETEAMLQAQSNANSAFEEALVYISSTCDVGCDHNVEGFDLMGQGQELLGSFDFDIQGVSGYNQGLYYVPSPGTGNAGECNVGVADIDGDCNWNTIYYGETVTIPLYTQGEDVFGGGTFNVKVRTPRCDDNEQVCLNDRKTIPCLGQTYYQTESSACDIEDNPVIMTWQITGERHGVGDFVEGLESEAHGLGFDYRGNEDSNIFITRINEANDNGNYVVLDINDKSSPDIEFILDALTTDPIDYPLLKLSFVQSVSNEMGTIPYLEYQIETDVPVSNDKSIIRVTGYTDEDGESYFWTKEGYWTSYSSSPINFAFQN